ncbi:MAG: hypothetical protein GX073_04695 [Firmicutes bacterium]|nr:hypothetical protein [Bacillota bacterium]
MKKKHRMTETEQQGAVFLAKADQLLSAAEQAQDGTSVYENCRAAVHNLLLAYLVAHGESEPAGADLTSAHLWEKCVARNPEIRALVPNVRLFLNDSGFVTTEEEVETMLDAANELWDFIFALIYG